MGVNILATRVDTIAPHVHLAKGMCTDIGAGAGLSASARLVQLRV